MNLYLLIGKAACSVGLHNVVRRDKWTPSIFATVVTEFEQTHRCVRCGKVLGHVHLRWDGVDMVDVVTPNVRAKAEPTAPPMPE